MQFVKLRHYDRSVKRLRWTVSDQEQLERRITANPLLGTGLGKGLRKIRVRFRGGARVIVLVVEQDDGTVYFFDLFLKSEKEDLTPAEYDLLRKTADEIRKERDDDEQG